jgi:signal transduction histidine kinase
MEQFTYAISHNLRAPIARLLGLVNIIQYANGQEYLFILDKIKESSFDLDSVIKDLSMILDAKYKAKEIIEFIDLNVKLEKTKLVLDKIIDENNTQIISDFSKGHILYANNGYIESIFYNLLSNALKYRSPDRPCVIKISSEVRGDLFMLYFSDNGIGIDLEKHGDKIFGLYKRFNLEIDGKGLGLYLVKSHALAMGGEAQIESTPDKGTTFKIILPIKRISSEEEQAKIVHQQS